MIKEAQVAELLKRCEKKIGQRLEQVRGNLGRPETRSAAIWELLVLDASMEIGTVEYEPHADGSPDIRVALPSGEKIWIEVAFLYPRFWKEERQSFDVSQWLRVEADKRGIDGFKISCRFDGAASRAGFVRKLPQQQEKNEFLKSEFVTAFFSQVLNDRSQGVSLVHQDYTLSVIYSPESNGGGGGGLVQEAPKHYKEHALYRVVKAKARQHDVSGVRLLCIGTDQSNALSDFVAPGGVTPESALYYAFKETSGISGVITVNIESRMQGFMGVTRNAIAKIYYNESARVNLNSAHVKAISILNFNRWKYHRSLTKYDTPAVGMGRKLGGDLSVSTSAKGGTIKIPSTTLLEILAGRTSLDEEYVNPISHLLSGNYSISSSSLEAGNPESGEASRIVFDLELDFDAVFERTRPNKHSDSEGDV